MRAQARSAAAARAMVVLAALAAALPVRRAAAAPYPVDVRVDDEAELDQLYYDGEIAEDERDRLRALFRHPVDLNAAGRDALYELPGWTWEMADAVTAWRAARGPFEGVEDLAAVEGLPRDVYEQSLPFVVVRPRAVRKDWTAETGVGATWRTEVEHPDRSLPGILMDSRVDFLKFGSAGALVSVRPRLGKVHGADPGQSLSARGEELDLDPGAFWIAWDGPRWSVIGGQYRVGFGQGLTLDTTRRDRPQGWTLANDAVWDVSEGTVSPWVGFHGISARAKQIDLPKGWLDVTLFGSYQHRDLYTTDVQYDRCPAGDPDCSDGARVPFLVDARTSRGTVDPDTGEFVPRNLYCEYPTLPRVLREVAGGANVGWWLDDRTGVGLTGFVGWTDLVIDAPSIRLAPSSRYPDRSLFGAAGLDFRVGRAGWDLAGEATVTDRGAPAAVVRARWSPLPGLEIVPSVRYYSVDYDNPWSGAEANADERLGNRGRDEAGGRLLVHWQPHAMVRLRADVDAWHHRKANVTCDPAAEPDSPEACPEAGAPDRPTTDLSAGLRIEVLPTRHERVAVWATYDDEDVSRSGRRLSYAAYRNSQGDFGGGEKVAWALSAGTTRIPKTSVSIFVRQVFEDVYALQKAFDQTWYGWLRIATNLAPGPSLSLRVKYFDGSAVADPDRAANQVCDFEARGGGNPASLPASCRGETYVEATLGAAQRVALGPEASMWLRLRAQWTRWLDHRGSWTYGTSCDTQPSRDEVGIQGSVSFRF